MIIAVIFVIVGCGLLAVGADRFVTGAAVLARNLGVPALIIGIVLVGFATSFPEMLVSGMASWQGDPSMGVGNAIGSNIANIGLVLGVTALIRPLRVNSKLLKREFPILFIAMLFAWWLISDGFLGRSNGIMLIIGIIAVVMWMLRLAMQARRNHDPIEVEAKQEIAIKMSTAKAIFWIVVGLVVLFISTRMLVYGATHIARAFGISELVIGLTVVAIGTSLPELAASIVSVLKKEDDIALGHLVGSNMFNILAVLAMPGLIHPSTIPKAVLWRDFPVMFLFTIALAVVAFGYRKPGRINRFEGAGLLLGFIGYMIFLAV